MAEAGRPTKKNDETVALLLSAFAQGAAVYEACESAKIDTATFYRWINNDRDFAAKIADAKDLISNIAKGNLARKVIKGDVPTSQWWLERKKKDEFSTRNELTGKDGKDLPTPILTGVVDVRSDNSGSQTE